jgi:hypothetical protein
MLPSSSFPDPAAGAARPAVRKAMWSEDEDRVLREQVRRHGPHNWDAICEPLQPERNAKSCRLRWCQHLDPRVDAARPFTSKEDDLIVKYQGLYGNRWSTIAEFLSGRTDNAIKNRWNSVLRKNHAHAPPTADHQAPPRHYWAPPRPTNPELTPGCLPLFPLAPGDVRIARGARPLPTRAPEDDDMSDAESSAEECLELFPLVPGDLRVNAGAAASSDFSCGADDPLTKLSLAPPARMVFEVMPLRAYRLP